MIRGMNVFVITVVVAGCAVRPPLGSLYYDTGDGVNIIGGFGGVAYVTQGNTWAGPSGGPATITYSFAAGNYATSEGGGPRRRPAS